jgi:hypothetical protein
LPLPFARITHQPTEPQKNQQTRMSSPKHPKNYHPKIHNQLKINHLQAKNKSTKLGILVPLNSLELKVDRKQKTRPGQKPGLRL